MNPENLSKQILSAINSAVDEAQIDLDELRLFALGPDRFYTCLNIYAKDEWDKYPYFSDDESVGIVPLDEWLDELDALAREHPGESHVSGKSGRVIR